MPVEIKELYIKVAVTSTAAGATAAAGAKPPAVDTDCIIAECVEQVLQILQNKTER